MSTKQGTHDAPLRFDGARMREDMVLRGWNMKEFSRRADVADVTVIRFLNGEVQTPGVALKLAVALGYQTARRYLISSREELTA